MQAPRDRPHHPTDRIIASKNGGLSTPASPHIQSPSPAPHLAAVAGPNLDPTGTVGALEAPLEVRDVGPLEVRDAAPLELPEGVPLNEPPDLTEDERLISLASESSSSLAAAAALRVMHVLHVHVCMLPRDCSTIISVLELVGLYGACMRRGRGLFEQDIYSGEANIYSGGRVNISARAWRSSSRSSVQDLSLS